MIAAAVCLAAVSLATPTAASHATSPATPAEQLPTVSVAFADPATGSTAVSNLGAATGWKVLTSATATQGGAAISTPGLGTTGWLSVNNGGGGAPGTEACGYDWDLSPAPYAQELPQQADAPPPATQEPATQATVPEAALQV
jgi:hypothetical protein